MALKTSDFLSSFIVAAVRLLARTWRLRVKDDAGMRATGAETRPPTVWVFWHNRLLVVPVLYGRLFRHRKSAVLISRSRDGGILAGCIERFGGEPVRGSSSRGGASALRELKKKMEEGYDVYITPDGPKGPRYTVGRGAVWLAQELGAAILPVSVEVSGCWRLGRWDGFIIPNPFARVDVTLHAPHSVPTTMDDAGMETEQESLRVLMMDQTVRH